MPLWRKAVAGAGGEQDDETRGGLALSAPHLLPALAAALERAIDGDGLYLGGKIFSPLGWGFAVEWLRDRPGVGDLRRTTWALALGSETLSLGAGVHLFSADQDALDAVASVAAKLRFPAVLKPQGRERRLHAVGDVLAGLRDRNRYGSQVNVAERIEPLDYVAAQVPHGSGKVEAARRTSAGAGTAGTHRAGLQKGIGSGFRKEREGSGAGADV